MAVIVQRLMELLSVQFEPLSIESVAEGYQFLRRMFDEWQDGNNRFCRPGETLLGAFSASMLVGVCGLNIDPYAREPGIGRLRHLYVLPAIRRQGVGQQLANHCIEAARPHFHLVRLRTVSAYAACFYERLGFRPVSGVDACTHVLQL